MEAQTAFGIVFPCVVMVAGLGAAVLGVIAFFQVLSLKKEVRRLAERLGGSQVQTTPPEEK